MDINRLYSYTRKAIDKYHMIQENDKIAIGISGGKDSLALLYALSGLKNFYPKKFEIEAVSVDLGIEGMDFSGVADLCKKLEVEYHIVKTQINEIVFDVRKEKNPCSLCAKLRKGAFNEKALSLGCNKIAYGHHRDDFVETLYMSLMYEGRINTFFPVTYLEKTGLTLIRPMMLISEADVKGFNNKYKLPVVNKTCQADGFTKRQEIKDILRQLKKCNSQIVKNSFAAIEKEFENDKKFATITK